MLVDIASKRAGDAANLPPLDISQKPLSFFEFWPNYIFYAPVFFYVLYLMVRFRGLTLPTASNPHFSGGGFYGESKSEILNYTKQYLGDLIPRFISVRRMDEPASDAAAGIQKTLRENAIDFPIVAKPDKGCRGAGVQPVYNYQQLADYIARFPVGGDIIFQSLIQAEGEIGVFYVRMPGAKSGRILSLTLKYFPYVIGDGRSTLRQLIAADPRAGRLQRIYLPRFAGRLDDVPKFGERIRLAFAGNHSKGTIFRNGAEFITPAMEKMLDELSQKIPEFYFGRYDLRFDDFEKIRRGEPAFNIIEINGGGAEVTHIWDSRMRLFDAWRDVMQQYRLLWEIGAINRRRNFRPMSVLDFWRSYRREKKFTRSYPPTL